MTSQSPRIYTYKITFEEVPYYYYGVHKEKRYDEYYMGSPKTHKWCWDFYTPKKQILEVFDYTDDGYIKAQEVEGRLIKPVYTKDKWCLNACCLGVFSLESKIKAGLEAKKQKTGIHAFSSKEKAEAGKKGGKISIVKNKEDKVGIFSLSKEELSENGKKANSQRWMCLETEYVTNSGALSKYQKARGIDTTKRVRIL